MYIPERFRRTVTLHIVKNLLVSLSSRTPLLLGIHGPSGYGKTYQCEQIMRELGVKAFLISGGQLESHEAGMPAQLIRHTYLQAGKSIKEGTCKAAVVIINDVDTGLGHWGELVQYTVNRQIVFGELMHLADYPTMVENRDTRRIPIILTGNNFTKLYEPLVRAGRMSAFSWQPTLEEKTHIVAQIFPEIGNQDCYKLIDSLENYARRASGNRSSLSTAFFSYLKSMLADDMIWDAIVSVRPENVISMIADGSEPYVQLHIDFNLLLETGKHLIDSGQLVNHLGMQ